MPGRRTKARNPLETHNFFEHFGERNTKRTRHSLLPRNGEKTAIQHTSNTRAKLYTLARSDVKRCCQLGVSLASDGDRWQRCERRQRETRSQCLARTLSARCSPLAALCAAHKKLMTSPPVLRLFVERGNQSSKSCVPVCVCLCTQRFCFCWLLSAAFCTISSQSSTFFFRFSDPVSISRGAGAFARQVPGLARGRQRTTPEVWIDEKGCGERRMP